MLRFLHRPPLQRHAQPAKIIVREHVARDQGKPGRTAGGIRDCQYDQRAHDRIAVILPELDVLQGAETMLRTCRPTLLLEANDEVRRRVLDDWLLPRGYRRTQPPGFEPWNHLYEAAERA